LAVPRASGPFFVFCALRLILGGTESIGSSFHVLRSYTHFRHNQRRRVLFSCFALPDSFWMASSPVFMFCASGFVWGCTKGVGSRFQVLRSRNYFVQYRGHGAPFSCFVLSKSFADFPRAVIPFSSFALPDTFLAVSMASGPVFMFCVPGLILSGTAGMRSSFHVLRSMTHFERYRGHEVQFSCFALPDSFGEVPRASGTIYMFCTPRLFFGGTRAFGPIFIVCAPGLVLSGIESTGVPFSCFALPASFRAVPRASGIVFKFCALGLIFRGFRGHRVLFSNFLLSNSFWAEPRASGPVFMFCAPIFVFDGTEGVGTCLHLLRSRTRFGWYRGRRVQFSSFAPPDSFGAFTMASGPNFMVCAPRLFLGGTEGAGSRLHFLRSRTRFGRHRGRRVQFSCFALSDSFSAVPMASSPVFMFCSPGFVSDCTEGVGSRFQVLRSRNYFVRYRGHDAPLSCFALSESFGDVPRSLSPVFKFCAPEHVFGGTEDAWSRFHVLCTETRFGPYRMR
jgi:hypothetical protein